MRALFIISLAAVTGCAEDVLVPVVGDPGTAPDMTASDSPFAPPSGWSPTVPRPTDVPASPTCATGALMGRLCAPQGGALAGARVYLYAADCEGAVRLYAVEATGNGYFALAAVPAGTYEVTVESGTLLSTFTATVTAGVITTVQARELACQDASPARIAVITGEFDEVQRILEQLAVSYELFDHAAGSGASGHSAAYDLLSSLDAMRQFDVLFFACGKLNRDFLGAELRSPATDNPLEVDVGFDYASLPYQNLRAYVAAGGSLYASDWAWPVVEGISPELLDLWGDETSARQVLVGAERSLAATIDDPSLGSFLGTPEVEVAFDRGNWTVIDSVGADAYTFVSGDVTVVPLARQDDTTVYGSPRLLADRPLIVGGRPFPGGGVVLFTTFHYGVQSSAEMIAVLSFVVFQL